MAPPHKYEPSASKNFFAALAPDSPDSQDDVDTSTDGGVSLSREPTPTPTPPQEPRMFTRAPSGGFGERLAMARGVRPQYVPPVPPRAAPTASTAAIAPTASCFDIGSSTMAMAQGIANEPPAYKPRYGGMPGSYTSPYDVGGKTPGDPRLPTSSMTWADFEVKHGSGRHLPASDLTIVDGSAFEGIATPGPSRGTISFSEMHPIDIKGKGKAPASTAAEQFTPAIPEDAEPRRVWYGPHIMVREACERGIESPQGHVLVRWFEEKMPFSLMAVTLQDKMIPHIIYAVSIPMTTESWEVYHKILSRFPEARHLNEQFDKGYHNFDQFTATHVSAASQLTWPQLTADGESLDEVLAKLVKETKLGVPFDIGRGPGNRPDVWPEQMGGTLRDYPLDR